eukprot:2213219-Pyramimonas_sp.AAC.1
MPARKACAEALADRQARLAAISKTRRFIARGTGELMFFRTRGQERPYNDVEGRVHGTCIGHQPVLQARGGRGPPLATWC